MRNVYLELYYLSAEAEEFDVRTFSITPDSLGEGRLLSPLKFSVKVRTWVQNEATSSGLSKANICNADGKLDDFANEDFKNFKIKEIDNGVTKTLADGLIERVVLSNAEIFEVILEDATKVLEMPLQDSFFPASEDSDSGAGTNTYYALEGQPRPLCVGSALSVKPVLAKRSTNEYHCSEVALDSTVTTYNNGVVVAHTDHSKGFTLNVDPADGSAIVADVEATDEVGVFTRYSILNFSEDDLDFIDANKGYEFAYYQDNTSTATVATFLKWFTDSITGWAYADEVGDIRFGYLSLPKETADIEINYIGGIKSEITVFDDLAPNITSKIGYDRNWYVYTDNQIASGATDENASKLTKQWRGTLDGANTIDDYYTDNKTPLDTCIRGQVDAQSEIDNVTELYSERKKFYTFDSAKFAQIGQTAQITYPRYDLESGKNLLCVGYEIEFIFNTYRLTFWG